LPVIEEDDYDEAYRSRIVSEGFPADLSIDPLTYEDWQPPLYYLLLTPVYRLNGGSLVALRSRLYSLGRPSSGLPTRPPASSGPARSG
jgi:hypothetical protein